MKDIEDGEWDLRGLKPYDDEDNVEDARIMTELTAKQLQEAKIMAEKSIIDTLNAFNQLCVDNDFQLENVDVKIISSDRERRFDVDLGII